MSRRANPQRVYEYLRYGATDHGEETLFLEIRQLPAAHYVEVSLDRADKLEQSRYWELDLGRRATLSMREAAEKLRDLFLDSVRLHLRSDVPVGTALSGGIDSSAIACSVRHLESDQELHTFSYVADDRNLSEERWIDIAATAVGAVQHKTRPEAEQLVEDLDHLIAVQDEPFASTSIYAQHRIFRLAKEAGIKVMLDGQGADELLGGYAPYLSNQLASLVVCGSLFKAAAFGIAACRLPHVRAKQLLLSAGGLLLPEVLRPLARSLVRQELKPAWLNEAWFTQHGVEFLERHRHQGKETLRHELYHSLEAGLRSLLRYEDRNSMAYSIESRVPFLTPQLAEFIYSLPAEYIVDRKGISKSVFRRAMRGIVPDAILDRKDKIGFATPEQRWLTVLQPWVESVLKSESAAQIPALNRPSLLTEWENVLRGHRPFDWRVWRWVNLVRWAELQRVEFA